VLKDLLEGKPLRHPIHPMLVHFPIGFLVLSFLLDLVSLAFPEVPSLLRGSFYAMLFGIIAALLAAVPGFVDYSDIRRDHPGKVTASRHMILNLMVVAIYGINLWIRSSALTDPKISLPVLLLSIIGIGLLSVSGYLGGHLIYDEGIAVGRHKRRTRLRKTRFIFRPHTRPVIGRPPLFPFLTPNSCAMVKHCALKSTSR